MQSARTTQLKFRLDDDLNEKIEAAARDHGWGVSEEIRRRLEASFAGAAPAGLDPALVDIMAAIGQAAVGAGKMFPSSKPGDTTKYETFVEAAQTLMAAFAPEGHPAVTQEQGLRLSYQLVGLALGALGDRGLAAFARLPEIDRDIMSKFGDKP
jgi:hypothetical protein